MSYDPTRDPNSGYGNPPYGQPQGPSGQPQGPSGQPQGPSGPPQGPYGVPPQDPYSQPPAPYGAPPQPQNPYGASPYPPQPGYGYSPPAVVHLPLGVAIQQAPKQYLKVLTKPSAATFAEELPKAAWDITWIQILALVVVPTLLGLFQGLILVAAVSSLAGPGSSGAFGYLSAFTVSTSIGGFFLNVVYAVAFFFVGVGIQFLLAKAFSGQGTFLAQAYTVLLYQVPVAILVGLVGFLLAFIPIAGPIIAGLIGLAVLVYSIVLNIFSIMAVHRLSGGKATGVVLIPYGVLLALGLICAVAFASFFFSLLPHS